MKATELILYTKSIPSHWSPVSVSWWKTLFKALVGIQNVSICYFVPDFPDQHHLQQLNVFQASLSISGMPHRPLGRAQSSPATASIKGAPMGEVPIKHLFTTGTLLWFLEQMTFKVRWSGSIEQYERNCLNLVIDLNLCFFFVIVVDGRALAMNPH